MDPTATPSPSETGSRSTWRGVDDLIPERNLTAIYLYVDDADALYDEWNGAGIDGRVVAPSDTSYGLGEGACLDRDANLIRFGSPI